MCEYLVEGLPGQPVRRDKVSVLQHRRPVRQFITLVAVTGLLAGCAQGAFSTREGRIGPDDGTDACRPELVALDSTGNFFGAQILTGAAIGAATGALAGGVIGRDWKGALIGAAVGGALGAAGGYWSALQQQSRDQAGMLTQVRGDLSKENAQIDRTQQAFDRLGDCRFRQAQQIRGDYAAKRIDRVTAVARMNAVKQRALRDLALGQQINSQIGGRGQQFEVAADNLAPGTKAAIAAQAPRPRPVQVRQATVIKVTPDSQAPDVGRLNSADSVTVTGTRGGYASVQTSDGQRGYVPTSALQGGLPPARPQGGASEDVRTLAGSNAARRDSFSESVAVYQQAANTGFEIAG